MMSEDTAVQAGLMQPTQGLYQQPNLGVAPLEAPQVQQPAPMTPMPEQQPQLAPGTSQRTGFSVSTSTPGFISREDAFGPVPAPVDLSGQRQQIAQGGEQIQAGIAAERTSLGEQAEAERRKSETLHGSFDKDGKLVTPGMDQAVNKQRDKDLTAQTDYDAVTDEFVRTNQTRIQAERDAIPNVDPGKIWHDNSAFQNAAGLASAFLGGMLAVSTGSGRNMGLEAIERAIDRDINAQEANIANAWKKAEHSQADLDAYERRRLRSRQNLLEKQVHRLDTIKLGFLAQAETFSSQSKQAELRGAAAKLDARAGELVTEVAQLDANLATAQAKDTRDAYLARGTAAVQRSTIATNSAQTAAANRANRPEPTADQQPIPVFNLPNGERFYLSPHMTKNRTPAQVGEMANKLTDDLSKKAQITDALQSFRQLVADTGSKYAGPGTRKVWGDDDVRAVQDAQKRLAATIAQALSGSQYADAFRVAVEGFVGGPKGWVGGDPLKSQTKYVEDELAKMDRDFVGRGVLKGQRVEAGKDVPAIAGPTPSGQPVLPKGAVGERMVPFSAKDNFYFGDVKQEDENKPVFEATLDLGRTVFSSDNPHSVHNSLQQLNNAAKAPVAAGINGVRAILMQAEVTNVGGKNAVRYPFEGKDRAGTKLRTQEEGVQLMRAAAVRAAVKADSAGDKALASSILNAMDSLEKSLTPSGPEQLPPELDLPAY